MEPKQTAPPTSNAALACTLGAVLARSANASHAFKSKEPLSSLNDFKSTSSYVSCVLLDMRSVAKGRPPAGTVAFMDYVLLACHQRLLADKAFEKYLSGLSRVYCSSGGETNQNRAGIAIALIEHAKAEYELMGSWLPKSVVKSNSWCSTVFDLYSILEQAHETFGTDKSTEDVVKTAALLVWNKKYPSIQDAKAAYDKHLKDAASTFGTDKSTEDVVKTAAYLVWKKTYPAIQDAKAAYDKNGWAF